MEPKKRETKHVKFGSTILFVLFLVDNFRPVQSINGRKILDVTTYRLFEFSFIYF